MVSVTGFASVAGGGGSMIPLPPLTSEGFSPAKAKCARNRKRNRPRDVLAKFVSDMERVFYLSGQFGASKGGRYPNGWTGGDDRLRSFKLILSLILHDRRKGSWIERRAADERAVDFFFGHQGVGVLGL